MTEPISLTHRKHRAIDRDYQQAARAAHLSYVSDRLAGITRHKRGTGFYYQYHGKHLTDKAQLKRIRALAIPPSWKDVWICADPCGHIQATGTDLNGRKQYRYHPDWNALRNETKFHRLLEFGRSLPRLRETTQKDIMSQGLSAAKVMATVIELMQQTYIRIGNNGYEKLYGSYGLTTMKDKHVNIMQEKISFSFTGKKGISHSITIRNKRLARVVKACRDVPGKELFQYYDQAGEKRPVDSGMINHYIKEATGGDFSAKDFRTWAGSLQALENFRLLECTEDAGTRQKNIVATLDKVSEKLGNTRNICRKYYVHPGLIELYKENKLTACLKKIPARSKVKGLSQEEQCLLYVLEKCM